MFQAEFDRGSGNINLSTNIISKLYFLIYDATLRLNWKLFNNLIVNIHFCYFS